MVVYKRYRLTKPVCIERTHIMKHITVTHTKNVVKRNGVFAIKDVQDIELAIDWNGEQQHITIISKGPIP